MENSATEVYYALKKIAVIQQAKNRNNHNLPEEIEKLVLLLQKLCSLLATEYFTVHFGFLYNIEDEGGLFSDKFKKYAEGQLLMVDSIPKSSYVVITKVGETITLEFFVLPF